MFNNQKKYISLKEAAKISGYAPDYIGQLIRSGKLFGKQIYCNVAWMTTEDSIQEYIQNNKQKNRSKTKANKFNQIQLRLKHKFLEINFFKSILYLVIIMFSVFFLILFYIFSIGVERKLQEGAIKKIENNIIIENE